MKKVLKTSLMFMVLVSIAVYGDTSLNLNFTKNSQNVEKDVRNFYKVHGFAGDVIESKLTNLSADVDLYVKIGKKPIGGDWHCKSIHGGTKDDICRVTLTEDSDVYIAASGYDASDYSVTATLIESQVKQIGYDQEVFGISPKEKYRHYKIHANAGDVLKIRAYELDADGNLFVKLGSKASWDDFDKKSNNQKLKDEEITIEVDNETDVYISLYASEFSQYTVEHKIKVTRTNAVDYVRPLTNGISDSGSIEPTKWAYFKINALSGDTVKSILNGLNEDADLFVKVGAKPTKNIYDCRPYSSGTRNEECTLFANEDTTVYIGVNGFKKATNFTIRADVKKESKLLFKSGFENGVYLDEPTRREDENSDSESSNTWWQRLKGSDTADFSWPIKLQCKKGQFQMIVDSDDVNRYIENEIIEMQGINNENSRVLHQIIKEKEKNNSTQDPYVIHINKEQKKLYVRYSLKFSKNLKRKLGKDGWLTFFEFKTTADYRVAIYVYEDKNSKLYWYAHGDNVVLDDRPYKEFWFRENRNVDVPVDKWFDVEIFWNRSKNDDGRVWIAIDGQKVIDYKGSTKLENYINQIMLFTNYSNAPIEQWVDNVEIWSDFPCGKGKSCH